MTGKDDNVGSSQTLISKLDIGDPLFLHPSDSSSLTIVGIKLKGTENYRVWSSAMKLALEAKNKFGFIDGKCKKNSDDDVLSSQWDRCNSVVLSWLLNSVSEELYLGQVFSKLASEVWIDLKETYDKVDGSIVYDLYKKINCITQNGSSVSEYYHKLNTMWKQFDAVLQLPTCSCQAAKDFNDFSTLIKLMQFLMGLDDVYQPVRTNLLTREPLPSVKVAFSIVSREESHRNSSVGSKTQNVSFASKTNQTFDQKKKEFRGPNPNLKCTHCNKLGHTIDRCFELVGYPSSFKKKPGGQVGKIFSNSRSNISSVPSVAQFSPEQVAKLLSLLGEKTSTESQSSNMGGFEIKESVGDWLPSSVLLGKSPYELMFGFKPSYSHVRTFGCLCFSTILNDLDKLSYNAEKCVLIGYSNVKKGYKLWSLDNKKEFYSRDVKFYETVFPFKSISQNVLLTDNLNHLNFFDSVEVLTTSPIVPNDEEGRLESHEVTDDDQQPIPSTSASPVNVDSQQLLTEVESSSSEGYGRAEDISTSIDEINPSEGTGPSLRRSSRKVVVPKKIEHFVLNSTSKYSLDKVVNYSCLSSENLCFIASLNKVVEPSCYEEAASDPRWVEAMNKEMEALFRNNTWVLTELPQNRKAIGCKWDFRVKYKSNGEVERFKARLVAKGFNQREGLDFGETFSPVVKMVTARTIITVAVYFDWPLFQLDVDNAFLHRTITEDVYMKLPPGYYSKNESKVCKLVKSLYGLKQAPRKWNERLTNVLLSLGFVQSKCDHSLFILSKDGIPVFLLVYVDDIVVTGNSVDKINQVKHVLNETFKIKDLGVLKYFLGIEVLYDKNTICLSQRKYCLELLSEFGYLGCKPVNTPIKQSYLVSSKLDKDQRLLKNITGFQKLIGKLIYLSLTRPDISYTVQFLSQFMHSPNEMHLNLALRLLRYLKQSPGKGLSFKKSVSLNLLGFADSDWGKCLSTRKSVTGFCIFLGDCLVSWKSKKQSTVSRSTAEAEYRAMCSATCELIWLKNLLFELNVQCSLPMSLKCDSQAAISIAANPVFHERTKHFELDLHFLREKVADGVISTIKVDSESQLADVFTKGLGVGQHEEFCKKLTLVDLFKPNE
ncbi:putative RNA-directed DNA polymerase [Helianthus annuus]|nr:putative RNA-directed DNA polymerase [Helianthus annuus]